MRLLIFSDAHGSIRGAKEALFAQPQARHVFFLGDGTRDIPALQEEFPDRTFYTVRGNGDLWDDAPQTDMVEVGGKRVFFTHGHLFGANEEKMALCARLRGADILLYGHTHVPRTAYLDGLHVVNPGSVTRSRQGANSYAVIDIEPSGILPIIIRL